MNKPDTKPLREDAKTVAATARDGTARVAASAEMTYEQLLDQVAVLKADLATLMETARDTGAEVARDTLRGARRAGRRAASAVEDGYEQAEAQVEGALTRAGDYTRTNPATALGLAAGAGFLLALLLARR